MDENVQNDIRSGLLHIDIQNPVEWYTFLYKLIYGSVQNRMPFLKIVQFGLRSTWSTWEKKFVKMDESVQNELIYI